MTKHTILFLAANPSGTDPLALDREARAIQAELERSGYRDCFEFETRWAVEPLDVLRELRKLRPSVVHYSGHANPQGLFVHATDGRARSLSIAALEKTFGAAGESVQIVVLNACYTEQLADALLGHVDCVVGTSGVIHDDAARSFAIGFYGGLGERESVAAAYKQGCAAVLLLGSNHLARARRKGRDVLVPQRDPWRNGGVIDRLRLKIRAGVDPGRLILAEGPPWPHRHRRSGWG
ncbi:MAG: CHAT domain-containing protein [Deltaproteobacteria bacterium]|nr:MAG: CHAT domain-containing protein [Deltaproteobacteria bacterium]TMQ27712.1 MAG: CHAT domain-containing protein [Deltaproteobacteria bacterium]